MRRTPRLVACAALATLSCVGNVVLPPTGAGGQTSATAGGSGSGGPASCADGAKDGSETDVDCGGGACPPCALGKACLYDTDCTSGSCFAGACAPPGKMQCQPTPGSCANCIKDAMETDVDCGGDACPPCGAGKQCLADADCTSGHCKGGACTTGAAGAACFTAADCASAHCVAGPCFTKLCCQ